MTNNSRGRWIGHATLLALSLGAALAPAAAQATPASASANGRLAPVDAVMVIDHSGSNRQSDPEGRRLAACAFSADFLASLATPGLDHELGLVPFGSTAPDELAVGMVKASDAGAVAAVRDACQASPDLVCTDVAAGLRRASEVLGPPRVGRRRVVTVFTDGRPDTCDRRSMDAMFGDIGAAMAELAGAEVHVVGLDADGTFSSELGRWRSLGSLSSISVLDRVGPGDLEARFTTILRGALGLARGDERQLTTETPEATVMVKPYQEALVVSAIAPASETAIELVSPTGAVVGQLQGRAGVLRRDLPGPGEWRLRLARGAAAIAAIDVVPMQARVVQPGGTVPVGRDLTLEATFLTTANQAVAPLARFPRFVGAAIVSPRGGRTHVTLDEITPGHYRARRGVPVADEGAWTIELLVKGATESVIDAVSTPVNALRTPYLAVPKGGGVVRSRQALEVPLELRVAGQPVDAPSVLAEDPAAAAVFRFLGPNGDELESGRVDFVGGSRFLVRPPVTLGDGDRARLIVELGSRLPSGETVADRIEVSVVGEPLPEEVWADRLRLAATVIAALGCLAAARYVGWLLARPPISGRFEVGGQQVWMNRARCKRTRITSPTAATWWTWGARSPGAPVVWCREGRVPWPFRAKAARRLSPAPEAARPSASARAASRS